MTIRTMYDSDNLARVPHTGASMIGFYVDLVPAYEEISEYILNEFPKWSQIPINRTGINTKNWRVLDVERGAISPNDDLETMITEFNETSVFYKYGGRPIVYSDRSNIPNVRVKTGKYILGRDYYIWVATLDGTVATAESLGLPSNALVACQNKAYPGYDSSVVFGEQWVPGV